MNLVGRLSCSLKNCLYSRSQISLKPCKLEKVLELLHKLCSQLFCSNCLELYWECMRDLFLNSKT